MILIRNSHSSLNQTIVRQRAACACALFAEGDEVAGRRGGGGGEATEVELLKTESLDSC